MEHTLTGKGDQDERKPICCRVLSIVVLALAVGIGPHDGRNDLSCRGVFGVNEPVWVGAADEDKLDADGDGIGCEGSLRGD
jgi:hypothetical protein